MGRFVVIVQPGPFHRARRRPALAETVRFELTEESPPRQFSRLLP